MTKASQALLNLPEEELAIRANDAPAEQHRQILRLKLNRALIASIDNLRLSMEHTANSNDKLSQKVHCLNIILTWATVIGSIAAISGVIVATVQLFK